MIPRRHSRMLWQLSHTLLASPWREAVCPSPDAHPLAALGRAGEGVDHALDGEALRKVDHSRRPARHRIEKLGELDHLELIEAESVAGRPAQTAIGRMTRRRKKSPEAAPLGRPLGDIEIELVHALIIEPQHALRAMHLDLESVLAPMRHAARGHDPAGAGSEAQQGVGDVVILDRRSARASGHRPLFVHYIDHRGETFDRAYELLR